MTWQLLGQIDDDELLVEIPQWLADKNVGYTQGVVPTAFVGRITTESDKAIQLTDSAAASSIRKLAHRISRLEQNDSNDQKDWLNDRLAEHRENVNNPPRGYYRRLDSQIINPLTAKEYIEVVERSKYRYISLTESGKNTLEAFQYLWRDESPLLSEHL